MIRTPLVLAAVLAGAIAAGMAAGQGVRAHEEQAKGPMAKVTPLLKTTLAGMDDKEVNIVHIVAPPGFETARHEHPGHVFLYVVQGAVTIDIAGEAPLKLGPGDVLQEPPGKPMVGRNLSSTHGAELVLFQIGDKDEPLTVETE